MDPASRVGAVSGQFLPSPIFFSVLDVTSSFARVQLAAARRKLANPAHQSTFAPICCTLNCAQTTINAHKFESISSSTLKDPTRRLGD